MSRNDRRDRVSSKKEEFLNRQVRVFGKTISQDVLMRAITLVLIFVVMALVVTLSVSIFGDLFSPQGRETLIEDVRNAGPAGALVLLLMEIIQVVVAFIPGEVVQMVAGLMYGPWLGTAIIALGCFVSMWLVYGLVRKLGQPFVESMVSTKHLESFRRFEQGGKMPVIVFLLFLIPGLPKDVFTYLVPLTSMPKREYLAIAMIARMPGIFMSTHAADGLLSGNIVQSVVIFSILAVLGIAGIVFKDKIMGAFNRRQDDGD